MEMENAVRAWAGIVVLVSAILTITVSQQWVWLTIFAGANLLQSAFTKFCIAEIVLKRFGVGQNCSNATAAR